MMPRVITATALLFVLVWWSPARAQGSRAEEIARLQAEKATQLRPPQRSGGEKALKRAEQIMASTGTVYPWLGSIYPGGLLAGGAGFRQSFLDNGAFNALGAYSLRQYKLARVDLRLPSMLGNRLVFSTGGSWMDAPKVAFYGIGNDSSRDARQTFEYTPTMAGGMATLYLTNWLSAAGGVDYLAVESGLGTTLAPQAPGLGSDVTYLVQRASLAIDWRESAGYSRSGGLYRVAFANHHDRDGGLFTFRQAEAEAVQLLPLFHGSSVIALRGLATVTDVDAGRVVPVFMLPALGGGSTLRGFQSWRFRDRHRLLLSGEYRWSPAQVLDMAIFVDAGKVVAERSDLKTRNGLHTDYGIGFRIHGLNFTAMRLDVARSREGLIFNLGAGVSF